MRVFFEGYHYKKSDIEQSLWNDSAGGDNPIPSDTIISECFTDTSLYQLIGKQEDPEFKFNCVGYFHCPKINDSIFIMPKVFVNVVKSEAGSTKKRIERVFATEKKSDSGYKPEELIFKSFFDSVDLYDTPKDVDKKETLNFITSTAIWIYQSIKRYVENKSNSCNLDEANLQRVTTTPGQSTETLLDTIISLIQFYKEHRSLFTFIAINRNHGTSRINWRKTINRKLPTLNNRKPVYFDFYTKNKVINYDEELIVLFLSAMELVRQKFYFSAIEHEGYELLPPHVIQNLMETGKGIRKMNEIRHKYFSDELVQLWQLMMQFFRQTYDISAKHYIPEMLIVRKYDRIFEDMVDCLIGEDLPKSINYMKNQEDGKTIDHIYIENSVFKDGKQIFYIGDSKYYKEKDADGYIEPSKNSVAKQYTYAKNVIQYCMNIFNSGSDTDHEEYTGEENELKKILHYRDDLTEGYNITPNFFLHGQIFPEHIKNPSNAFEEDKIDLVKDNEVGNEKPTRINFQWENRLFDRDTLILQTYNINFLYLLSMYVGHHENAEVKTKLREKFRRNFIELLEKKYVFFKVVPHVPMKEYVKRHFRKFIGKMFRPNDNENTLIFAFDKEKMVDVTFMQDNVSVWYYHLD